MNNKKGITYSQLATIFISYVFGILTVLIINNFLLEERIEFGTLGLLVFLFSIVFAVASVVLAITAINLGKSSEQIMIERSDKSIELQNEIYVKTTEALKKIESSTGVTEKRIEDIISGRAGDIASKLIDDNVVKGRNRQYLESEIKKSLSDEPFKTKEDIEKKKEEIKANKEYTKFKDQLLLDFANTEKVKSIKIGDGSFVGHGIDLLDGFYEINGNKIGICTFFDSELLNEKFSFDESFIKNLLDEIITNFFSKVYFAFNAKCKLSDTYNKELQKLEGLYKKELIGKIEVIAESPDEIVKSIIK